MANKIVSVTSGDTRYTDAVIIPSSINYGNLEIPVTSIGYKAFYNCSGMTSVTIPNSITSIWNDAFYACSGLTRVDITDFEAWCKIEFGNSYSNPLYYAHHLYLNGKEIKDLIIPNSVTYIRNNAFEGCNSLRSVIIPNSVIWVDKKAFYGCSGLKDLYIGEKVTNIYSRAFAGCNQLENITIVAIEPPIIQYSADVFETMTYLSATLYVPEGSINSYKEVAPWSNFFTIKPSYESGVKKIEEYVLYDIFNLNGQLMKHQASQEDINVLEPGIYIINGKKLMVK